MEEHDPVGEQLLGRLRETLGDPEAAMLMDRFATRDDVRRVEHSVELMRRDLVAEVKGLHAEIHKVARQQLLTFLTVCLSVFGVFNGAMLAILKLT